MPGNFRPKYFGIIVGLLATCNNQCLNISKPIFQDYSQFKNKKWLINETRKRRKGARARPLYPNGWFAVMDADKLGKGEATEGLICGMTPTLRY